MSILAIGTAVGLQNIRQHNGLFSLNDLHRASGGQAKHRPSEWLRNRQTKELITEIDIAGIPAITSKPKVGTFACRELVVTYAAWISAAFHLKVIRVFMAASVPATAIQPDETHVALLALTNAVNRRFDQVDEQVGAIAKAQRLAELAQRDLVGSVGRTVDKLYRSIGAQKKPEKLDPNRDLSEAEIEQFNFLVGSQVPIKEIARRMHRTHEVFQRHINSDPEAFARTYQQSLF